MKTDDKQSWKRVILIGGVVMVVGSVTCSVGIARPEWGDWQAPVGLVGFLVGLGVYLVGDIVNWWRGR